MHVKKFIEKYRGYNQYKPYKDETYSTDMNIINSNKQLAVEIKKTKCYFEYISKVYNENKLEYEKINNKIKNFEF
jgi:hypothetical protein